MRIRRAEKSELEWVNQRYDEVKFVHSTFDREVIVIAEIGGQKAGLGRLVIMDERNLELGGIYVFDAFQGRGIARGIVEFLLTHVPPFQTVYCIPFEHLTSFYMQCGFSLCHDLTKVPKEVLDKYKGCKEKYTHPTALLVMEK